MDDRAARGGARASGSGRDASDQAELHFLLLHYLRSLPTADAADAFEREATAHGLLPRRPDPFGHEHAQTYEEMRAKYPHVAPDHLARLVGLAASETPAGRDLAARGLRTLVGAGPASLVPRPSAADVSSGPRRLGRAVSDPAPTFREAVRLAQTFSAGGGAAAARRRAARCPPSLLGSRVNPLTTVKGHRKELYCVIFDKTGRSIVTGSDDTLVKVWCATTGTLRHACRGHTGEISFLDVNATNELVASASFDYTVRTWFLETGHPAAVLLGHQNIVSEVRFCPTAPRVVLSASWDRTLRVWDAYSDSATAPPTVLNLAPEAGGGAPQHGAGGAGGASAAAAVAPVAAVSETPEEQAAAAAAAAAAARAAQEAAAAAALSGAALSEPDAPEGAIMCTAWDASGTLFACGTTACKTHVWSVKEAALRSEAPGALAPAAIRGAPTAGGHLHDVTSCAFSRSGAFLLTASRDGQAKIWERGLRKKTVGTFEKPKQKTSGGAKNVWRLRSVLSTPADAEALRRQARARRGPVVYAVEQAVWSRDDALVVAAMSDFTLRAWDAASGALLHTMRLHTNKVHVLQCHPFDPRVCVSAGHDGRVAVWDVSRGRCVRHYDGGEFETLVLDGSWSPCGSRIVVSDEKGQWCLFGTGCGGSLSRAKHEQFLECEFVPEAEIARDAATGFLALAADPDTPFHAQFGRNGRNRLVDSLGNPYGEPYQSAFRARRLIAANVPSSGVRVEPPAPVNDRAAEEATAAAAAAAAAAADAAAAANRVTYLEDDEALEDEPENSGEDDDDEVVLVESSDEDGSESDDEEEDPEASDSDFAARRRIRRRRDPSASGSSGDARRAAGAGRAERASRRETAREDRVARRAARRAAVRRTNRPRRATRRLVDEDTETEEEYEDEDEEDEDEDERGRMETDDEDEQNETAPANGERANGLRVRFTMKRSRDDADFRDSDEAGGSGPRRARVRAADNAGGSSSAHRRKHAAYAWLLRDRPSTPGESYVPQLGDALVYVPRGHHAFLERRANKAARRPWLAVGAPGSWRHAEPARAAAVRYAISREDEDETVAVLTLRLADPASANFGAEFELELPRLEDADFLVPAHRFRAGAARGWRPDDRCAVCWRDAGADGALVDTWYRGVVVRDARSTAAATTSDENATSDPQWRGSPWNALAVEYSDVADEEDKMQDHSFWELFDDDAPHDERIDPDAPRLDDATSRRLGDRVRRARAKPQYDVFVDEIEADAFFPQRDGSDANYCALVPVPLSLDLVARRLRNRYYRALGGFLHDVRTIRENCELFNGLDSEYTEAAARLERELTNGYACADAAAPVEGVASAATMPPPGVATSPGRGRRR